MDARRVIRLVLRPGVVAVALLELLAEEAILLDVDCPDWRAAIRAAGRGLQASGVADAAYTDEMLAAIDKHGPYIVIAPGIALAHSRPSPAVRRTGLSWVRPAAPVEFGHPKNDPVRLVVGLAALDHEQHQTALVEFATVFADPSAVERLSEPGTAATLREALSQEAVEQ